MKRVLLVLGLVLLLALPVVAQDDMMAMGVVNVGGNDDLGAFLVDADGMTLYMFANDTANASNCTDGCLENWPALTVESADDLAAGEGVGGQLGVIERADTGELQVTYNRMPLYYWVNDAAAGDATGHNVNDVWFVVRPQTVTLGGNDDLGSFLTGPNGMTLYMFANDADGMSNCTGGCLENWPALTVGSADELYAGIGAVAQADLDLIEREDTGELQVTYNGMPLYYWVNDAAVGDATGHNVNDVWFVVKPEIIAVGSSDDLGDFLVGSDDMTLYMFANDADGMSACVDGCAVNWPPLTIINDSDLVVGEGVTGELGTITRDDGSIQVTYNGMPLYFWIRDLVPGDATGHNVNDVWFVVEP